MKSETEIRKAIDKSFEQAVVRIPIRYPQCPRAPRTEAEINALRLAKAWDSRIAYAATALGAKYAATVYGLELATVIAVNSRAAQ